MIMASEPRAGVAPMRQGAAKPGAVVTGLCVFCGLFMVTFGIWAVLLPHHSRQ
jgi:hypothetical protein